jgi:membrane protease YdiL (CAAX protease family)
LGVGIGAAVGGTGSYADTIGSLVGLWAGLVPGTIFVCRTRETGNLVSDLGLRFQFPSDLWGGLVGLASQFLLLPLVYVVIQAFVTRDLTKDLEKPAKELTDNAHGPGFFLLAVLLIVGAPLVEELFYRGLLLRSLKRSLPAPAAVVVCGVLFGAAHFYLLTLPGLALFGIVLAYLAERSGRLGPNVIAHAAFNAATVILLWNA